MQLSRGEPASAFDAISTPERIDLARSATLEWVEFRDARVMIWADGLIERTTAFLDIDEARAAAERLARERG